MRRRVSLTFEPFLFIPNTNFIIVIAIIVTGMYSNAKTTRIQQKKTIRMQLERYQGSRSNEQKEIPWC